MGGPTYSGYGPHRAVRIRRTDYAAGSSRSRVDGHLAVSCLACGRTRSTDHTGTVWLAPDDPRLPPRESSQADYWRALFSVATAGGD